MASPKPDSPREDCACGNGLKADRCCALDWTAPWPQPASTASLDRARTALAGKNTAEAEHLLVDFLEQSPSHSGGLMLLYELRTAQNRVAAAEALLVRIVRLDPNNLAATQNLALLLFGKGALAEAEFHARNAVRLAPSEAQSHNLMG